MTCKWGHDDCKNIGDSCSRCLIRDFFYGQKNQPKMMQKRRVNAKDGRSGSRFEYANHKRNESLVSTGMTLNSGATTKEKGDEQIRGIIEVMEELKTQMADRAKGVKTFTIQRKWLDKLNREANLENKEFWYLKFAFSEDEGVHEGGQVFIVTEQDIIMSMVATMVRDRRKAAEIDLQLDLYKKKFQEEQAKAIALQAEIDALKASIEYTKAKEITDNLFPEFEPSTKQ